MNKLIVIIIGMLLFLQPFTSATEPDLTKIGVNKDETYTFHVEKYDDQPGFTIIDYDSEDYLFVEIGKQFEMKIINSTIIKDKTIQVEFSTNGKTIPGSVNVTQLDSFVIIKDWEYFKELKKNFFDENLKSLGYVTQTFIDSDEEFGLQTVFDRELTETEKNYTAGALRTYSIDQWVFDKTTGVLLFWYSKYDITYEDGTIDRIEVHITEIEHKENQIEVPNLEFKFVIVILVAIIHIKKYRLSKSISMKS